MRVVGRIHILPTCLNRLLLGMGAKPLRLAPLCVLLVRCACSTAYGGD